MAHRLAEAVLAGTVLTVLCVACTGCGGEFDETKIHNAAEHTPFHLDSEQASFRSSIAVSTRIFGTRLC
jgi:hypothetical protein